MKRREWLILGGALAVTLLLLLPIGDPEAAEAYKADVVVFFTPEDNVTQAIRQAMDEARGEVVVAMYTFTNRDLAESLIRAHHRGVSVRILVDDEQASIRYSQVDEMKGSGLDVVEVDLGRTDNNHDIRYHNKFAVIDREIVVTGSFNWTTQADEENYENLLLLRSKKLAKAYLDKFEVHWERFSPVE